MKKKELLIISILILAVGFAAISTTLIINGSAKVSENTNDFSVIFTAATLDGTDVYDQVISQDKKTITFETSDLKTINQASILSYEVTNNSANYDAEVSVNCKIKDGGSAKYTSIKNELEGNATKVLAKRTLNGTLTITLNKTSVDEVNEEYVCSLEFNAVERNELGDSSISFNDDSWDLISKNIKSGKTHKYNVGDTKEIDLGDLGTHTVRIANMSECTNGETSESACGFVIEFTDIINQQTHYDTQTNVGGWRDSKIRTYVNETLYNSLPNDLANIVLETKVISGHGSSVSTNFETTDKLYLLSTKEIYGETTYDTIDKETRQLDYYKNEGVTNSNYSKAIKSYNSTNSVWWLRSARSNYGSAFNAINATGATNFVRYAMVEAGVSPAFRIA